MISHKISAFLVLLVSLTAAFNVGDYLYASETNVNVGYDNFTLNGTHYSIVSIDGTDTFLLKEDEPVSDKDEIASVMYSYYMKEYYPSDDELDELRGLIQTFNDSRNDGYNWKNKEEYVCRDDVLFANGKVTMSGEPVTCVDEESCEKNALLLFAAYGEGLGLGSPQPLYDAIYAFVPASFEMDEILANYVSRLDNLSEDNVVETIEYIEETAPKLKKNADKVEANIFRTPRLDDEDDRDACYLKCFALCPSFDLDQDAADDIESLAGELADKINPLSDYEKITNDLHSRSMARINYSTTESQADYYGLEYNKLNSTANMVISMGEEATTHVSNASLHSKLTELKSLYNSLPDDIDARDFSTTESDFESYVLLLDEVRNQSEFILTQYNETANAKNIVSSLILVLETKDLDPVSSGSLELLKNQSADLDAEFRDGMTFDDLVALEGKYEELHSEGQKLLKKESDMPATKVLLLFRGFARNVNSGIANVAEETEVVEKSELAENKFLALALFSLLLFVSLTSIVVLAFLLVIATTKFYIPKTNQILASAFLSVMILVLGFSVFTYLFLSKTSSEATLNEFLEDFDKGNSTAIVVNLADTAYSDALAMNTCASNLAEEFQEQNRSWVIYRISPNSCIQSTPAGNSTLTLSECEALISEEQSSFELGYSTSNEAPKFSVIYENKAEINANLDYYESCPLVSLFS